MSVIFTPPPPQFFRIANAWEDNELRFSVLDWSWIGYGVFNGRPIAQSFIPAQFFRIVGVQDSRWSRFLAGLVRMLAIHIVRET